ncbi:hypothetical protein NPIL_502951, partial [Nephila pilipes]
IPFDGSKQEVVSIILSLLCDLEALAENFAEVPADSDTEDQNPPNNSEEKKAKTILPCNVKRRLDGQPNPGFPSSVVSDRRSKPTSATCRHLWKQSNIQLLERRRRRWRVTKDDYFFNYNDEDLR